MNQADVRCMWSINNGFPPLCPWMVHETINRLYQCPAAARVWDCIQIQEKDYLTLLSWTAICVLQFFITCAKCDWLDNKHIVFGVSVVWYKACSILNFLVPFLFPERVKDGCSSQIAKWFRVPLFPTALLAINIACCWHTSVKEVCLARTFQRWICWVGIESFVDINQGIWKVSMEECYLACSGILFDLLGADFLWFPWASFRVFLPLRTYGPLHFWGIYKFEI